MRTTGTYLVAPEPLDGERGSALIVALLVLFLAVSLGMSATQITSTEIELAGNYAQSWRAFYAADGVAQASFNDLIDLARSMGRFPEADQLDTLSHQLVADVNFTAFQMRPDGAAAEQPLSTGFYQGLVASTRPYVVDLTAETTRFPRASAGVTMGMYFDIIPIFQFAVFYEDDLELFPGPPMMLSGRVHTNSDMYLGANNELRIDSNVTSAGAILNRRKDDGSRPGGATRIRDGLGNFPAMNGLDSTDSEWIDRSLERWRGNVRSGDHGVERLNRTISDPTHPRTIIEPGLDTDDALDRAAKIFHSPEMSLRILNGQSFDAAGNTVDLGAGIGFDVLYDQREAKTMLLVELDMQALEAAPDYPAPGQPVVLYVGSFAPGNGIPAWSIVEDTGTGPVATNWPSAWAGLGAPYDGGGTEFAIKVKNGAELANPITIVTANPAYIQGDYNAINKKPAALLADAITILSNAWDDNDDPYSRRTLGNRPAATTTMNLALMLGNTETTTGHYNGGVENLPRFLENWSGRTFRYRGSLIDLWYSEQATGPWRYGSPVYNAPNRDWEFDTDFSNPNLLPPATPKVYTLRLRQWSRH